MKIYPKLALSFSDQSLFAIDFHKIGFTASIYKMDICIAVYGSAYGKLLEDCGMSHTFIGRNKKAIYGSRLDKGRR